MKGFFVTTVKRKMSSVTNIVNSGQIETVLFVLRPEISQFYRDLQGSLILNPNSSRIIAIKNLGKNIV